MKRGYIDGALGQVHYRTAGDGEVLVFLPPGGRSSQVGEPLFRVLSQRYRVVAFDTPGCGNSDALPEGAGIKEIAVCFVDIFEQLELGPVHIVGLHTGHKIGAAIAVHPRASLKSFVLIGNTHSLIPDQPSRNAAIRYVKNALDKPWWDSSAAADIPRRGANGESLEAIIDQLQSQACEARLYDANFAYDMARDLALIDIPTLVIEIATPHEDRRLGRQGEMVRELIRGSRLHTLQATADSPFNVEKQSDELAGIIEVFCRSASA